MPPPARSDREWRRIYGAFWCWIGILVFLWAFPPDGDESPKRLLGYWFARAYAWTGWLIPPFLLAFPDRPSEKDER